jgi:hypothetical protein
MAQTKAGGFKANLLAKAINTKVENYRKTGEVTHTLYDALVFRKASQKGGYSIDIVRVLTRHADFDRCEHCLEEGSCSSRVVAHRSRPRC